MPQGDIICGFTKWNVVITIPISTKIMNIEKHKHGGIVWN